MIVNYTPECVSEFSRVPTKVVELTVDFINGLSESLPHLYNPDFRTEVPPGVGAIVLRDVFTEPVIEIVYDELAELRQLLGVNHREFGVRKLPAAEGASPTLSALCDVVRSTKMASDAKADDVIRAMHEYRTGVLRGAQRIHKDNLVASPTILLANGRGNTVFDSDFGFVRVCTGVCDVTIFDGRLIDHFGEAQRERSQPRLSLGLALPIQ